jgi:type I restriction enzyme S subunit
VIDHVDDYLFDEPLVLLSEDGFNLVNRTTRVAFKAKGKIWVNNHAHILRPHDGFNIDYLAEYLESIDLKPYITGTYQRKLNKSACEQIPIPIPPVDEQERIAATIGAVDESSKHVESHAKKTVEIQSALLSVSGLSLNHV